MPRIEVFRDDALIAEHELSGTSIALGRHRDNDIVLEDPTLSRFHARLERRGSGYAIADLSVNGVFVNGNRVANEQPLRSGDALAIGRHLVLYFADEGEGRTAEVSRTIPVRIPGHLVSELTAGADAADSSSAEEEGDVFSATGEGTAPSEVSEIPADEPAQLTAAVEASVTQLVRTGTDMGPIVVVLDGSREVERVPIGEVLTIGRSSAADVVIGIAGLSRRHAQIFREGDSVFVEDLGSQNGTWVNNRRIQGKRRLAHGDVINFYEYQVVVLLERRGGASLESQIPDRTPLSVRMSTSHSLAAADFSEVSVPPTAAEARPSMIDKKGVLASSYSDGSFGEGAVLEEAPEFSGELSLGGFVEPTLQDGALGPHRNSLPGAAFSEATTGDVDRSRTATAVWPSEDALLAVLDRSDRELRAQIEVIADEELVARIPVSRQALRVGAHSCCEIRVDEKYGLLPWQVTLVPVGGTVLCYRASPLARVVLDGSPFDLVAMRPGQRIDLGRVLLVLRTR